MLTAALPLFSLLSSPALAGKRELNRMLTLVTDPTLRTLMQSRTMPEACSELLQQTRRQVRREDHAQALLMISYEHSSCAAWWDDISWNLQRRLGRRLTTRRAGEEALCPGLEDLELLFIEPMLITSEAV